MSTFDLTFDNTFRSTVGDTGPVAVTPVACKQSGTYLYWLSPWGWIGYLFTGYRDRDTVVDSLGSYRQAGVTRHVQKEAADVVALRLGKLDEATASVVATIYASVKCFELQHASDGSVVPVEVSVEPGTFRVWSDGRGRSNLEVKIIYPALRSARA